MKKVLAIVITVIIAGCSPSMEQESAKKVMNFDREVSVNREGVLFSVPLQKIFTVLPLRGNLPSITRPDFVPAGDGDAFLKEDDEVIGINFNGVKRAYPVKIMRQHIIVNDMASDTPFLITYDPMSKLGLAYLRAAMDKTLNFNTSDKVYNSNPLFRDRETKSYWSQFTGEAVMGRLAGVTMKKLNVTMASWGGWKSEFPDTTVLSIKTGFDKDYSFNQYEEYYKNNLIVYDVENEDKRLHNKTTVYGIVVNGKAKAYPHNTLTKGGRLRDNIAGGGVTISLNSNGIFSARLSYNGEELNSKRLFWYAWAAFHPDTEIYSRN